MKPILYILRGLPGSGKTTLSKMFVRSDKRRREADMFHMADGEYNFIPENAARSHEWCRLEVEKMMIESASDCSVSNTFTRREEYAPYIALADKYGFDVAVFDCHGPWKNTHDVPDDVLKKMADRWEPHVR